VLESEIKKLKRLAIFCQNKLKYKRLFIKSEGWHGAKIALNAG